jgi:hypothetical protein
VISAVWQAEQFMPTQSSREPCPLFHRSLVTESVSSSVSSSAKPTGSLSPPEVVRGR